jgi:hypothetical protein
MPPSVLDPTFTRAHTPAAPVADATASRRRARVARELLACAGLGVVALPLAVMGGAVGLLGGGLAGVAGAWLLGGLVLRLGMVAGRGIGARALGAFLAPSGNRTPYVHDYSQEQALVQRGDVAGALAAYERHVAERPTDAEVRARAAELYAGAGGDPRRAAELLRELRRIPGLPPERDVHASNRLVDLYAGPLADPGRALVELRRLAELYPETRLGREARAAIARRKSGE